ncbi:MULTISPECIES: MerR family DNA-binding protein [Pseudomonas]|uniref:MerR family DNA-binding protein n=1 Tax=Pseudomonas TaxID=286 RepID=UPI001E34851D|nr:MULTISPECIES: MerR family DNA-binding protein [Pseudomonas]
MGLIAPQRMGSDRSCAAHHLKLVQMIRQAQVVDFKLAEMSELLAAKQHQSPFPLAPADQGIEAKRVELNVEIHSLLSRQADLTQLKRQLIEQFGPDSAVCTPVGA